MFLGTRTIFKLFQTLTFSYQQNKKKKIKNTVSVIFSKKNKNLSVPVPQILLMTSAGL